MPKKKSEGLGDDVEKVLKKTGIKKIINIFLDGKDCGCEERKQKLNTLFPRGLKPRCLTEKEYIEWGNFKKNRRLVLSAEEVDYICKTYSDVYNRQYWRPDCTSCSVRPLLSMINRLDEVYYFYEKEITNSQKKR